MTRAISKTIFKTMNCAFVIIKYGQKYGQLIVHFLSLSMTRAILKKLFLRQ